MPLRHYITMPPCYCATITMCLMVCNLYTISAVLKEVMSISADFCLTSLINIQCNKETYQWVKLESVVGRDCNTIPACDVAQVEQIRVLLADRCRNTSTCSFSREDITGRKCAATINYDCIQGVRTTPRTVNTTPPRGD